MLLLVPRALLTTNVDSSHLLNHDALTHWPLLVDCPVPFASLAKPILVFFARLDHAANGLDVRVPRQFCAVHLLEKPFGFGEGASYK